MAAKNDKREFTHQYLTMNISLGRAGLELHPRWGADCVDTECLCTDGCTNCSGDCTGCTATCRGADSTGALIPNRQGEVELVLDLASLAKVLATVDVKTVGTKGRAKKTSTKRASAKKASTKKAKK